MSEETVVYLRPPFGEPEEMKAYFEEEGFSDMVALKVYDKFCFVTFPSLGRAESFIAAVDGAITNNYKITAMLSNKTKSTSNQKARTVDPAAVSGVTKTIKVDKIRNFKFNERELYNIFRETGFIRQIEIVGDEGFIQFDTEADAIKAIEESSKGSFKGHRVVACHIADRILNIPPLGIQLQVKESTPKETGKIINFDNAPDISYE